MEWLSKLYNYIKVKFIGESSAGQKTYAVSSKEPLPLASSTKKSVPNEITMVGNLSDEQIQTNSERAKYISVVKNPPHKVKSGESIDVIAGKYGVETRSLLALNSLTPETAKKIKPGQSLKIPQSRKIKNVKNLNDIAKSMGVSLDFIKKLKRVEDGSEFTENKFHNTPYKDKNGVLTIGIGHVVKKGEPQKLTNAQVCELCAKDLLKMEENLSTLLGGQKNYDKLPQSLKEALLDMTFNKGTAIIEKTEGLLYCLKAGKYEAAINKFTNNKSAKTGQEMSGLSKRRLFDISVAVKMYNGKIPQSNINTAQQVYNRGVQLLRMECRKSGANFKHQLAGFNQDVQSYLGGKIKLTKE